MRTPTPVPVPVPMTIAFVGVVKVGAAVMDIPLGVELMPLLGSSPVVVVASDADELPLAAFDTSMVEDVAFKTENPVK